MSGKRVLGKYGAEQTLTRRRFLYLTAGAGVMAAAVAGVACGGAAAPAPKAAPAKRSALVDPQEIMASIPGEILERLPLEPKKDWTEKDIQRGGKVIIRDFRDVPHLDPVITSANNVHQMAGLIYSRLVQIQADQDADPLKPTIVPDLARSWEISPDGLTYTFKLHENAKWQNVPPMNGRPVTAEDVRWCYERLATLKESVHKSVFELVNGMDAVDKTTLRITLKEPHVPMLTKLGSSFISIVPREVVEQADPRNTAVGSGPFILKEVQRGNKYVLRKNPDYFMQGIPYIDEYEQVIIPDDAAALAAFRSGQVDAGVSVGTIDQLKNLFGTNPNTAGQRSYPIYGNAMIDFRLDKPPFKDVRVRRALALAIDRGKINKVVFGGMAHPGTIIPWNIAGFSTIPTPAEMGPYYKLEPDYEGAKQLLKEAGYPNGFDVTLTTGYGTWVQFINQGQLVVEDWKRIGLNAKIQAEDYTAWSAKHFTGTYESAELASMGIIGFDADDWTYGYLHSKATNNWWHLNDPEADKLLEAQRRETDPEKRTAILRKIFDMENDQIWRLQLMNQAVSFSFWQPRLKNFKSLAYTSGPAYGNHIYHKVWLKQS